MSEILSAVLPRDENTDRKAWCEPKLVEYDVETVTAVDLGLGGDALAEIS